MCLPGESAAVRNRPAGTGLVDELADDDDFAPVAAQTTHAGGLVVRTPRDSSPPVGGFESSRLIGILVHRLFQHSGWPPAPGLVDRSTIREGVLRLMRPEETAGVSDVERLIDDVVSGYETFGAMTDLRQLYQAGAAAFEVPFTMAMDGRIVHGTIDCLVRTQNTDEYGHPVERVIVLELKTGRARPEHQDQVAIYRQAAALLFPGALVESRLVYLDGMVAD